MGNECKKSICECETCLSIKKDNLEIKLTFSTKSGRNQNLRNSKISNQNIYDEIQDT